MLLRFSVFYTLQRVTAVGAVALINRPLSHTQSNPSRGLSVAARPSEKHIWKKVQKQYSEQYY